MPEQMTILITGCSTGIGRATAERLAASGHTVYATARNPESVADLEAKGCRTMALDVTDEASMEAAVARIEEEAGGVDALVNNAGYSQSGAVETLDMDALRRQFETNVFGLVRMTQLVLPGMRSRGHGRIVNISSMGANFTFPGAAPTTRPSTRSRRSPTPSATRSRASGSTSSSSSRGRSARSSTRPRSHRSSRRAAPTTSTASSTARSGRRPGRPTRRAR